MTRMYCYSPSLRVDRKHGARLNPELDSVRRAPTSHCLAEALSKGSWMSSGRYRVQVKSRLDPVLLQQGHRLKTIYGRTSKALCTALM